MTYIIATANMKGGVGKTSLTVNLATCLAKFHQKRVLVVDLDTQVNATLSFMSPANFAKLRKERGTLKNLINPLIRAAGQLTDMRPALAIQDYIRPYLCNVKGLDLLPGDIDLYDEFLVSEMLHERAAQENATTFEQVWNQFEKDLIKKLLQPALKDYDFIILDCAPGYNLLTRSALAASHFYLLPAKPEPLSIVGIQLLERRIAQLKKSHEGDRSVNIQLLGIVFTMVGGLLSNRYYQQVMQRINQDFSEHRIFKTRIPIDVNVSRAADGFTPAVLTHPNASGSKAFQALTEEFLGKLKIALGSKDQTTRMSLAELE